MAEPAEPALPSPGPGDVHVFTLDLGAAVAAPEDAPLSADERARAARFVRPEDRARSVAARGALRRLLGAYAGLSPESLAFAAGAHGKPELAGDAAARAPRFNVAHSGRLVLLAFAAGPVGVDVEAFRAGVDVDALARRFFAPDEIAALAASPAPGRSALFFRVWTRKEAYLKARGTGLSFPLDAFTTTEPSGAALARVRAPEGPPAYLADLAPQDGYAGAVVTATPARLVVRSLAPGA